MQAVVIGASGGIGGALVTALTKKPEVMRIFAMSRSGVGPEGPRVTPLRLDITDEEALAAAAAKIRAAGGAEIVLVATGLLSDGADLQPEKSHRQQSTDAFHQIFQINTIGPALAAKHFLPVLPRKGRAIFAALSARVGSITDNRLGGWHAYRASKAALNMLIRNYAIEVARWNPESIIAGLHPGTVATGLSAPFQKNVPAGGLFTPAQSAAYLLDVLAGLTPADSGYVFDWRGERIPA